MNQLIQVMHTEYWLTDRNCKQWYQAEKPRSRWNAWMMVCLWCCVLLFSVMLYVMLCVMVFVMVCVMVWGVRDVMSDGVSGVMDVGEVEWLISCCFGVLIYDGWTDGQTYERTDICTSDLNSDTLVPIWPIDNMTRDQYVH